MSRVAKNSISIPSGVSVKLSDDRVEVKGKLGEMSMPIQSNVSVKEEDGALLLDVKNESAWAMAGTTRSLLNNMVIGVSEGFNKKLELVGVGYRGKVSGSTLNLTLGFNLHVPVVLCGRYTSVQVW